jgi:hypothetical protein
MGIWVIALFKTKPIGGNLGEWWSWNHCNIGINGGYLPKITQNYPKLPLSFNSIPKVFPPCFPQFPSV